RGAGADEHRALRGRSPAGRLVDRGGPTRVAVRPAEHDGVHPPPVEPPAPVRSADANGRPRDRPAPRAVRPVADGRPHAAGVPRGDGRLGRANGGGGRHQHLGRGPVRRGGHPEVPVRRRALRTVPPRPAARGGYPSSVCVITGASATTVAPSSTRIVRTPWLARPTRRMSEAATRITIPDEEMTNMSWSFDPMKAPASSPVLRVSACPITPLPPRPFVGY